MCDDTSGCETYAHYGPGPWDGWCMTFNSKSLLSMLETSTAGYTYSKTTNPQFQKMASRYCPALTSEISTMKSYLKSEQGYIKTEKKLLKTDEQSLQSDRTFKHKFETCKRQLNNEQSRNQAGQQLDEVTSTSLGKENSEKPTFFGVLVFVIILSWGIIGFLYRELRKSKAQQSNPKLGEIKAGLMNYV